MAPDMSPERYAEHMTAEQRLVVTNWPEGDVYFRSITWACVLAWCAMFWLGVAWYFDLLPDWSWL